MFTVTEREIDPILRDFGIQADCAKLHELERYHYEKEDPSSTELRLIVKAELTDDRAVVIRLKNEKDVTLDIVNEQSRFAAALAEQGIETPKLYASDGQFARRYRIGGCELIVTVEDFVPGELREIDEKTAEETGSLLARMHNIAESAELHVHNEVLFDPLRRNDLFSFEEFAKHRDFLLGVDAELYGEIVSAHASILQKVRAFENGPRYAVQGDISDCNLYRRADGVLGLFDFNRSGDNVLYYDAVMQALFEARLMVYAKDLADEPEPVILPAFLRGYHRERAFTEAQKATFPYLYALASAFWLGDIRWNEGSLRHAVEKADTDAALRWMREIRRRVEHFPPMPV